MAGLLLILPMSLENIGLDTCPDNVEIKQVTYIVMAYFA